MNRAHIGGLVLIAALAAWGCGPGDDSPDTDAHASDGDSGESMEGLTVEFHAIPMVTDDDDDDDDGADGIDSAEITLVNLRVLADAAPDERTTEPSVRIDWEYPACGDADCVTFDSAPPGLYSLVAATVVAYEIDGEVTVADPGGDAGMIQRSFEIEDPDTNLDIEISFDPVALGPGTPATMPIDVLLGTIIAAVDWDAVTPSGDGDLEIGPSSSQIGAVRQRMEQAFRVRPSSGSTE